MFQLDNFVLKRTSYPLALKTARQVLLCCCWAFTCFALSIAASGAKVINVSSTTANGSYKASSVILVTVAFDAPVTVKGVPQLALETGAVARTAAYTGGSGTPTLTFTYIVQPGDTSARLDCTSTRALALANDMSIRDGGNNDADTTLPAPGTQGSLGANRAIIIDTTAPLMSRLAPVVVPNRLATVEGDSQSSSLVVETPGSARTYQAQIAAAELSGLPVGSPIIALGLRMNGGLASFPSFPIRCSAFEVKLSQAANSVDAFSPFFLANMSNPITVYSNSLTVNVAAFPGGETPNGFGLLVNFATPYIYQGGDLVLYLSYDFIPQDAQTFLDATDTQVPARTNLVAISSGAFRASQSMADSPAPFVIIQLVSSGGVDGTPELAAVSDTGAFNNDNVTSNTKPTLVGRAEAGAAVELLPGGSTSLGTAIADGNGNWSLTSTSVLADGTYGITAKATDIAGNVGAASAAIHVTIDTTLPQVLKVSGPANGSYRTGQNLDFTVIYSENVTVDTTSGTPTVGLNVGPTARSASYFSGSGSSSLVFRYTVPEQSDNSGPVFPSSPILLNGGTIADLAGNQALLILTNINFGNVSVDTAGPALLSAFPPANRLYGAGQNLDFVVSYSENVVVKTNGGTPTVSLKIGATARNARYASGSGSNALVFRYTIQVGDTDVDGIESASEIVLNGGTIQDGAGNAVGLRFAPLNTSAVLVDSTAPNILNISVPAIGTYRSHETLDFTFNYSERVFVNTNGGVPNIRLFFIPVALPNLPGLPRPVTTERLAYYLSGSGSSTLVFRYTLRAREIERTIVLDSAMPLNGGTICDEAGNLAALSFNPPSTVGILVDTSAPSITSITGPASGIYRATQNLDFVLNFTMIATVNTANGTPALELIIGSTSRFANYISNLGSSNLLFRYVVQAGEIDLNGITLGPAALLNGGTINGLTANPAVLTLPASLFTAVVLVDTMAPTISISPPSAALTRAGPVTYAVKYADPNFASSTLAATNVILNATGNAKGSVTVSGSGADRIVIVSSISGDGTLGIALASGTAQDSAGNTAGAAGPSAAFTVDNTAPNPPSTPSLAASDDTGRSNTDNITRGANLTFTGTAEINSTVRLASDTLDLGTAIATGGQWSIPTTALTEGAHIITATATDAAGNRSAVSGRLAIIVDTTAPATTDIAVQNPAQSGATSVLTFAVGDAWTDASNLVVSADSSNPKLIPNTSILVGGSGSNRTVRLTPAPSEFGSAFITISVTDLAGNSSSNRFILTVKPATDTPVSPGTAPVTNQVGVLVEREAPQLGAITNQRIFEDAGVQTIELSGIRLGEASSGALQVSARSSDPRLIPTPEVSYLSPQSTGQLRFAPIANGYGKALITVTVSDGIAGQSSRTFEVEVIPVNDPPTLDAIPNVVIQAGATNVVVPLTGISTGATNEIQVLNIRAISDTEQLIRLPQVFYTPPARTAELLLEPWAGRTGEATITLFVWDDGGVDNGGKDRIELKFKVTVPKGEGNPANGESDTAKALYFQNADGVLRIGQVQSEALINPALLDPLAPEDAGWKVRAVKDFDRDGQRDLLFEHDDGRLAVWLINGIKLKSAAFLNPIRTGDANWRPVGAADLNQDSQPDLLFQHTDGRMAVWLMKGLALQEAKLLDPASPGDAAWRVVGNGDFSRDGKADLVLQHDDGTIAIWMMDGARLTSAALLNPERPLASAWRVRSVLDLNQDGKPDLVAQHADGTTVVLYLEGLRLTDSKAFAPSQIFQSWRIVGP
jgi:hypothetical protein